VSAGSQIVAAAKRSLGVARLRCAHALVPNIGPAGGLPEPQALDCRTGLDYVADSPKDTWQASAAGAGSAACSGLAPVW
jgi:hypothetical protein